MITRKGHQINNSIINNKINQNQWQELIYNNYKIKYQMNWIKKFRNKQWIQNYLIQDAKKLVYSFQIIHKLKNKAIRINQIIANYKIFLKVI